jgi:hypothetical protein
MNEALQMERKRLLIGMARGIERAAARGLFGGQPIALREAIMINGPRAGALEVFAGLNSPALLRTFGGDDGAILRQFIPWPFTNTPTAFMAGRNVRLEAGWPPDLADANIKLSDLGRHPTGDGRWLVGRNERGHVLTAGLNDDTPHWLLSGTTGSGKTTALVSAVAQLARDPNNRIILIDAKHGKDFRHLAHLQDLCGPLADDVSSARAALTWACREMAARYSGGQDTRRLIIVVDEVQELTDDPLTLAALRKLIAQGRGASIHCMIATQHPTSDALGDRTIGKNLGGRLALRVIGPEASRVAVGSRTPRADYLLGHGDGYACAPTATHRVQIALFDGDLSLGDPGLAEWPEAESDLPERSSDFGGDELAISLVVAAEDKGRPALQQMCEEDGLGRPGGGRGARLLGLGRDMRTWLVINDYCLPARQQDTHPAGYKIAQNGKVLSVCIPNGQAVSPINEVIQ